VKRRSFQLAGAEGVVNIEIERIAGGSLDVHETDRHGQALAPSVIVHEWDTARDFVADLVAAAVRAGMRVRDLANGQPGSSLLWSKSFIPRPLGYRSLPSWSVP